MKTLIEVLNLSTSYLKEKGIEHPRREAEWVLSDALGLKRLDLYLQYDRPLIEEEIIKCREGMRRRGLKEPSQYISGKVSFAGCEIFVTKDVLIPRPETELLVEKISLELNHCENKVLWDLCTGSGCIGISLKKRFPALQVYLSDLSEKALDVAKKNALHNNVEVNFMQGDLFSPFGDSTCDYFVSNPPYVSESTYITLSQEVRDFEPKMALVSGESGFEMYEKIGASLKNHLKKGGKGWLELGANQGEKVSRLFHHYHVSYEKDWAGHDRFLFLEYNS